MTYQDALALFAATGRLVDADDMSAIVLVNGEERILEPAKLITAARMMAKEDYECYAGTVMPDGPDYAQALANLQVQEAAIEEESCTEYCDTCGGCKCHNCHCDDTLVIDEEDAMLEVGENPKGDYWDPDDILDEHQDPLHDLYTDAVAAQLAGELMHAVGEAAAFAARFTDHIGGDCDQEEVLRRCDIDAQMHLESEWAEDNTTSGLDEASTQERTRTMNFHDCSVLNKKHLFAGQDGYCRHCRPVVIEQGIPLTQADVEQMYAPMLADLVQEVGGDNALRVSIEAIRRAKLARKRGDSVNGRLTRELLDLILTQPAIYRGTLLEEYREFLAPYGIGLNAQTERDDRGEEHLVAFHDYSGLKAVQPAIPQLVPAMNEVRQLSGDDLREYLWRANAQEKRAQKRAQVAQVRESRQIVMNWVSSDQKETGRVALGPNTEDTRKKAAEYQAAARKKGFRVSFQLV
jgi:hypothetical protein